MYDFIDRPVTALGRNGRLLVWAMRNWVRDVNDKKCPSGSVACAFDQGNALQAIEPFLRMMALVNRHARERLVFCALPCNHVSEHEAIILQLAFSARSAPDLVRSTLALLVNGQAVSELSSIFHQLNRVLIYEGVNVASFRKPRDA